MARHPHKRRPLWPRRAFAAAAFAAAGAGVPLPAAARPAGDGNALQEEINAHMRNTGNPHYDRAIVISPDRFDEKIGAGLLPEAAVKAILAEEGYDSIPPHFTPLIVERLLEPGVTAAGNPVIGVSPASLRLPDDRICLLVPMPAGNAVNGPDLPLPGASMADTTEFINRHEAWHCKDRFSDKKQQEKALDASAGLPPQIYLALPEVLEALAMNYRSEVFADVAAVGEMIRAGHSLSILDSVSYWRQKLAVNDLMHISTPALQDMKSRITSLGLDAFRATGARDAEDMYIDVTEKNGLASWEAMGAYYRLSIGTQDMNSQVRDAARDGAPQAERALFIYRMQKWSEQYGNTPARPRTPEEAVTALMAWNWDADRALAARAREMTGGTEPPALRQAYVAMQEEIAAHAGKNPGNAFFREQSMKLRTAFLSAALHVQIIRQADGPPIFISRRAPLPAPRP